MTKKVEKDGSPIIKVSYEKCRETEPYSPMYVTYCETERLKVSMDSGAPLFFNGSGTGGRAPMGDFKIELVNLLSDPLSSAELKAQLMSHFGLEIRSIENKIKEVYDTKSPLRKDDEVYQLTKFNLNSIPHYKLVSLKEFNDEEE